MKIYNILLYRWSACFVTLFIWTYGVTFEISAIRWIGFVALMLSAIGVMLPSIQLYRTACSETKRDLEGVDIKDKQEIKRLSFPLDVPTTGIFSIIILAGCVIALNFFYYI